MPSEGFGGIESVSLAQLLVALWASGAAEAGVAGSHSQAGGRAAGGSHYIHILETFCFLGFLVLFSSLFGLGKARYLS